MLAAMLCSTKELSTVCKIIKNVQWIAEMGDYFFFSMKLNESTK